MKKEFRWTLNYLVKKPFCPHGIGKKYLKNEILVFSKPIEFSVISLKKTFRLVGQYKNIAVSADGVVYDVNIDMVLRQSKLNGYYITRVYDIINKKVTFGLVHRLVALAWIENNDYCVNNVVDHKDGNKLNNSKGNLSWVSASRNTSRLVYQGNDYQYVIVNTTTGIRILRDSLRKVAEFLGVDNRRFSIQRLPQIVTINDQDWVVYDSKDQSFDVNEFLKSKYLYMVKSNRGISYFKNKHELKKRFGLIGNTIKEFVQQLKFKNLKLIINTTQSINKYDIKNLVTGVEYTKLELKDVIRITQSPKSTILTRINKKYRYGVPFNNWILKITTEEEYTLNKTKRPISKMWKAVNDSETLTFDSLRKISEYFNVDKKTIKKAAVNETLLKNYKIVFVT